MTDPPGEVSKPATTDELMPIVQAELRRVARRYLAQERAGHTLQPTALINEAYVRLAGQREFQWQNHAQFIGVAAQLMRFILVDHARKKKNAKRGAGDVRVTFTEDLHVADENAGDERSAEVIALDEALQKLACLDERRSRIAELRYFGGLSIEETAEALSVSVPTVVRDWRLTKAWLHRELTGRVNT